MKYLYLTREQTALLASALRRIADAKDTNSQYYYEGVVIDYDDELAMMQMPDEILTLTPEPVTVNVQVQVIEKTEDVGDSE